MDFDDTAEDAAFRHEARAWLDRNADRRDPGELPTTRSYYEMDEVFLAEGREWQRRLYEAGWAGITWPEPLGGRGGTPMQALIFHQEESRYDVPQGLFAVAIRMAGPTLIAHGTPAQRERFLPAMLRGDEVWCQLFSEPGAGSDLASLSTRAVLDGDEWIVDGQKVWSSGAHLADMGILLARTDPEQPKHRGISFFVLDMRSPGVEVRPLRQMTGGASFNEVFLTGVRVPAANVVGEVNGGWRATMTTLANERSLSGASVVPQVLRLARRTGAASDPVVRQRLAALYVRGELLRFLEYRAQTALSRGLPLGPESSVMKLLYSIVVTEATRLAVAVQGPAGTLAGEDAVAGGAWQDQFLGAPSIRIAAGSDEIQRNVIGERVLGLPGEPRPDRDAPFSSTVRS